eukprot:SAG11_NODE_219_length_12168_cov_5.600083_10_plen_150_part_00
MSETTCASPKASAFSPVISDSSAHLGFADGTTIRTPELRLRSDDKDSVADDFGLVENAIAEQGRVREDCQKWLQILSAPTTVALPTPTQWCKVLRGVCNWRLFAEAKALVTGYSTRVEAANHFATRNMFLGFVSILQVNFYFEVAWFQN